MNLTDAAFITRPLSHERPSAEHEAAARLVAKDVGAFRRLRNTLGPSGLSHWGRA